MRRAWRPLQIGRKGFVLAAVLGVLSLGVLHWRQPVPSTIPFSAKHSIRSIGFSPDSRKVLVTGEIGDFESSVPSISDTFAHIYEVGSDSPSSTLAPTQFKMDFGRPSWSPDGKRIASGYQVGGQSNSSSGAACWGSGALNAIPTEGRIATWDVSSGKVIQEASYDPHTRLGLAAVEFSEDGQMLRGIGKPPALFSSSSGELLRSFDTSSPRGINGTFSADGRLVAISSGEGENIFIGVLDVSSGDLLWKHPTFQSATPQWSANKVLAFENRTLGPDKRAILIWDGVSRQFLPSPPVRSIYSFALNPHEPRIIYTEQGEFRPIDGCNRNISSWNWQTQKIEWTHNFDAELTQLSMAPDGRSIAMLARFEKRDEIWIFDSAGKLWGTYPVEGLGRLCWSPNSSFLAASAHADGKAAVLIFPVT